MEVNINGRLVGDGHPCYVVAEIGINHNGDLGLARQLVWAAAAARCDAVKFQKRTVSQVYSREELERPRESPFGDTNGDLKYGLEFTSAEYASIHHACQTAGIDWFASCWDATSVDHIEEFDPPCHKIASASLTDLDLVRTIASRGRPVILSTALSTIQDVDRAVTVVNDCGAPLILLHCVGTYPSRDADLNLRCIETLRQRYDVPVGYSGHERGLATTLAAVALGACVVERHITLDRTMWGSDQAASIEPHALCRLVRDIRAIESALGDGVKRLLDAEVPVRDKLRRVCA